MPAVGLLAGDSLRAMERPMTDWERGVVAALLSIDGPPGGPDPRALRDSLPHLVVTEECGCGCPSFFVRDARQARHMDSDGHFHYSNAATPDRSVGMFLLVRNDRPWSVDVEVPPTIDGASPDARPDPASLRVTSPYDE